MADETEIRIKDLPDTATEADLVAGNYISLDCDVTKKLEVPTLLKVTAQNALAGNVAETFDPERTSENSYKAGESVTYTDGKVYTFKVDHYGAWAAADVQLTDEFWRHSFSRDQYQDGYIPNNSTLIGDLTANGDRITISVGCSAGQKFWVRGYSSGNAARLWCTIDDYGRVKRRAAAGADTRDASLLITIEDGETGIVFNLFKNLLYFVACSFSNGIKIVSDKLKSLTFNAVENLCNTAIPYKKIYVDKYISTAGVITGDAYFDVYEYDVNPNTRIHIKTATGGGYIAFYDVDGVLVGSPFKEPNSSNYERVFYDVSVPATAVIIRVTIYKSYNGVTQVPAVISNDGFGIGKVVEFAKHIFAGKKILCIGDSITESGTWFDTLLEKTGAAQIWNRGVSGSTLASYTDSTDSMCDRADLDADDVDSHHGGGFPSDANVDVVIVWGGTNDFGNATKNVQFGTIVKKDKMFFLDGVFYLVDKLKVKYPTKPIYVCGIMTAQKAGSGDWNRYTVSSGVFTERTNWTGKTVTEYNEAIKQICNMTGVHYIDMEQCGISPVNSGDRSNYFNADGLHPTSAGGVRIGKFIAENLVFES